LGQEGRSAGMATGRPAMALRQPIKRFNFVGAFIPF